MRQKEIKVGNIYKNKNQTVSRKVISIQEDRGAYFVTYEKTHGNATSTERMNLIQFARWAVREPNVPSGMILIPVELALAISDFLAYQQACASDEEPFVKLTGPLDKILIRDGHLKQEEDEG